MAASVCHLRVEHIEDLKKNGSRDEGSEQIKTEISDAAWTAESAVTNAYAIKKLSDRAHGRLKEKVEVDVGPRRQVVDREILALAQDHRRFNDVL